MAQTLTFQEAAEVYMAGMSTATGPITWMPTTITTATCFPTTYIPTLPTYSPPPFVLGRIPVEDNSNADEIERLKRELAIVTADRDELLGCLHPEELL